MNKKNMTFALLMGVFATTTMFPMQQLSAQEEKTRIEHIACLSKGGALGVAQYAVNGSISSELIERDIVLFEKNSAEVLNKKAWAEGYLYSWMIPGVFKAIGIPTKLGAWGAGIFTGVSSVLVYNVWNSSSAVNFADRVGSKMIDWAGLSFPDTIEAYGRYYDARSQYLMNQSEYNKSILSIAPALPAALVGTVILAGVSKYSLNKLSNYNHRNSAFIQEMQQKYERNQVVIAQLKQIQYDANHS